MSVHDIDLPWQILVWCGIKCHTQKIKSCLRESDHLKLLDRMLWGFGNQFNRAKMPATSTMRSKVGDPLSMSLPPALLCGDIKPIAVMHVCAFEFQHGSTQGQQCQLN